VAVSNASYIIVVGAQCLGIWHDVPQLQEFLAQYQIYYTVSLNANHTCLVPGPLSTNFIGKTAFYSDMMYWHGCSQCQVFWRGGSQCQVIYILVFKKMLDLLVFGP
jgi:hypothetical protein